MVVLVHLHRGFCCCCCCCCCCWYRQKQQPVTYVNYYKHLGMLPATAKGTCRVLGNASHGLHSICPMTEMRCRLGGCCKGGGSKQQTGLHLLSLPQGRDKVLISMGSLPVPAARDKKWSPVCCLEPPLYNDHPAYAAFLSWGRCCVNHGLHSPKLYRYPLRSPEAFPNVCN